MKRFAKVMALFAVLLLALVGFDKISQLGITPLTSYAVYETRLLAWNFDDSNDYAFDSSLIELDNGARLKLTKTEADITDSPSLQLPRGNNSELSITEISDDKYKTALLNAGEKYYVDKNYKITEIPEELEGMLWLKTQNSDQDSKKNLSFTTNRPTRIIVGYDRRKASPHWLQSWTHFGEGITTEDDGATPFKLYYNDFAAGNILLGSNNKSKAMYVILLNNTGYASNHEQVSQSQQYDGILKNITFEADEPEGTTIKLQLRTAQTEQELESAQWLGPTSAGDHYTLQEEAVNSAHGSSGWLQYKAILETTSAAGTPTLNSVTISAEKMAYPASAAITANSYAFEKTVEVQQISAEEEANGQTTAYEYSTDSSSSWAAASLDSPISVKANSIAVRATLNSNTTHSPTIKSIKVSFKISICDERWQLNHSSCGRDDTRTRQYTDINSCGSTEELPADNGTVESCDYCVPSWAETNSSCGADNKIIATFTDSNSCYAETGLASDNNKPQNKAYSCEYDTEKPVISNVTATMSGEMLTITANITDKSATTAIARIISGDGEKSSVSMTNTTKQGYVASVNVSQLKGAYIVSIAAKDQYNNTEAVKGAAGFVVSAEKGTVAEIALNSSRKALMATNTARLEFTGKASLSRKVVMAEYTKDIRNSTKPKKELGKYVEIEADDEFKSNISLVTLRLNYSDNDVLAANISETSLAMYSYNETLLAWQLLNSTVNTALKYVEANTTHLSMFGVFGDEQNQTSLNITTNATVNATNATTTAQQTAAETAAASGGTGGSASSSARQKAQEKLATAEPEAPAEENSKESCSYNVSLKVDRADGSLSFINATSINAVLTNTGTCELTDVEISTTPSLSEYVNVQNGKAEKLGPAESLKFALSLRAPSGTPQPIQGFAVKENKKIATRIGKILITGKAVNALNAKAEGTLTEMPLQIEMYATENGKNPSLTTIFIGVLALAATAAAGQMIIRQRKSREKADKPENEKPQQKAVQNQDNATDSFEDNLKKFQEKWEQQQKQEQEAQPPAPPEAASAETAEKKEGN